MKYTLVPFVKTIVKTFLSELFTGKTILSTTVFSVVETEEQAYTVTNLHFSTASNIVNAHSLMTVLSVKRKMRKTLIVRKNKVQ